MADELPPVVAHLGGDDGDFSAMIDRAIADLDRIKESVDEFGRKDDQARVGVNGEEEVKRQLDDLDARLDEYGKKRETAHVGVDGGEGMGSLMSSIMLLGPTAIPMLAEATAGVIGLSGSFAAAGLGAAAFAAVAVPAIKSVFTASTALATAQKAYANATTSAARKTALQDETKALSGLSSEQRNAVVELDKFKTAWDHMAAGFKPEIIKGFDDALHAGITMLPRLKPLISESADAFLGLEHNAIHALQNPFWERFSVWLSGQANPAISAFGETGGNVLHGLAALFMDFTPLINDVDGLLIQGSHDFAEWATHLGATAGFREFMDYVEQEGPAVEHALGAIFRTAGVLVKAFAPIGGVVLDDVTAFLNELDRFADAHPGLAHDAADLVVLAGGASLLAKGLGSLKSIGGLAAALGPEGLALVALGAGIYEAYKHIPAFRKELQELGHALHDDAGKAITWFTHSALPEIEKEGKKVFGWITDTALPNIKQKFGGTFQEVDADIHQFLGGALSWAKGEIADFRAYWAQNGAAIEEAAERTWNATAAFINADIRSILAVARVTMPALRDVMTTNFHIIGQDVAIFSDLMDSHWSAALKTMAKDAAEFLNPGQGLVMRPIEAFEKAAGTMLVQAGKNIVEGLAHGIESALGDVGGAMSSLTKEITDHLPHSPAKKGPLKDNPPDKSGQKIIEMLIGGIKSEQKALDAELNEIAKSITSKMPKAQREAQTKLLSQLRSLGYKTTDEGKELQRIDVRLVDAGQHNNITKINDQERSAKTVEKYLEKLAVNSEGTRYHKVVEKELRESRLLIQKSIDERNRATATKYLDSSKALDPKLQKALETALGQQSISGLSTAKAQLETEHLQLEKMALMTQGLSDHAAVMKRLTAVDELLVKEAHDAVVVNRALAQSENAAARAAAAKVHGSAGSYLATEVGTVGSTVVVQNITVRGSVIAEKQVGKIAQKHALRHQRRNTTNGTSRYRSTRVKL